MHASNRFARGFTLIEVLAALVIVSLGMLGVIEAVGQTASNSSRMRDRTLAHWVAMNRLTTARLETRAPNIGKTSDEIEMAGRRWRWTMEVQETPVGTMRRIDVRVNEAEAGAGDEDDERSLATVTGFYGTAIAAAGTAAPSWSGTGVPGGPGGPGRPGTESPPGDRDGDRNGDRPPNNDEPPADESPDPQDPEGRE